jgi:hypothetical protein
MKLDQADLLPKVLPKPRAPMLLPKRYPRL